MAQIILDSNNNLIQGDFDNATLNNRTKLQTTTTNATTNVYVAPNGSSTSAGVSVANNSSLTNASKIVMATNGTTDTQIISGINGSGTYLPLSFYTNNALAAQLDTSGDLGVGSAPINGYRLSVIDGAQTSIGAYSTAAAGAAGFVALRLGSSSGTDRWQIQYDLPTNNLNFYDFNAATNRMVIDSSGNVTMTGGGNTTLSLTSTAAAYSSIVKVGGAGGGSGQIQSTAVLVCFAGNQTTSGVALNASATSWTSTSDERLKTDLKPIENAINKVSTLRAVTGRFKTDGEGTSRSFLIAQDVQKVLPEAVSEQDDELKTLGLAYTETIPLLVAAIKEQQTIINELKTRIEALESK